MERHQARRRYRKLRACLYCVISLVGLQAEKSHSFLNVLPKHHGRSLMYFGRFVAATTTKQSSSQPSTNPSYSSCSSSPDQSPRSERGVTTFDLNRKLGRFGRKVNQVKSRYGKVKVASEAITFFNSIHHNNRDTVTYNSIFSVLAKVSPIMLSGVPAAYIADTIFQEMKAQQKQQIQANEAFYESLKTSEPVSSPPPTIRIKPSARTYSSIMDAFARMGTQASAARVIQLFRELESRYEETEACPSLEPNVIISNIVLRALANSDNAGACLRWFDNRMPCTPDRISYNTVLNALSRAGEAEAAESLMRRMHVPPNKRSYSSVMNAWGRSGHPDKANALLQELQGLYRTTRDLYVEPNEVSYTTVIHAYAISKDPEKVQKAQKVLDSMLAAKVLPNVITYNSLLNCCANSPTTSTDVMTTVKRIYQQIMKDEIADDATFGTALKACANQLAWEDDSAFCLQVFQDAVDGGFVSSGVLWQFYRAAPVDEYRKYVPDGRTDASDLPPKWTRNSITGTRPPKRGRI